jgi:hypothetical protein
MGETERWACWPGDCTRLHFERIQSFACLTFASSSRWVTSHWSYGTARVRLGRGRAKVYPPNLHAIGTNIAVASEPRCPSSAIPGQSLNSPLDSLLTLSSYLVHSLRLSYLRNVDDPYGGRIISLSPSYTSNPYILAASLADTSRWPELEYPSSPPISDDEPDPAPPTPIRHHQTIMGNRSGALGMRVSGRRASAARRRPSLAQPEATLACLSVDTGVADLDDPPAKEVQFIPKFKGAAEMEARRKLRMLARRGHSSKPDANKYLNPELSSSEDGDASLEDDDEGDDFDLVDRADDMDEGDEFDPYAFFIPIPPMPDSTTATLLLHARTVPALTVPLTQPPSCRGLRRPCLPPLTHPHTLALDRVSAPSQRLIASTSPATPSPHPTMTKA